MCVLLPQGASRLGDGADSTTTAVAAPLPHRAALAAAVARRAPGGGARPAVEMEIGEEGLGKSLALRAVSYGTGSVASARPLAPHNSSGRESCVSCSLI